MGGVNGGYYRSSSETGHSVESQHVSGMGGRGTSRSVRGAGQDAKPGRPPGFL